jgi:putative hydrolase of the HAD superfamily
VISEVKARFSTVKAIYFDLDDTLLGYWTATKLGLRQAIEANPVDGKSTEQILTAWAETFRTFSKGLKDDHEMYQAYLTSGEPTRTRQMELTLQSVGVNDLGHARRLSHSYMTFRDQNLVLFHDALDVLNQLQTKYPIGLITNGPADIQNQEIDTVGIRKFLSNIFIEGEMRIGKPEPDVFRRAAAAVSCSPEELLMVGNSFDHDIIPAIEHGWATAWTRRDTDVAPSSKTGLPDPIPTSGPMPNLIIENLSELLPYLV